jgi:type I restriction enzyme S subunit
MALSIKPIEIINKQEYQLLKKALHWERVFLASVANVQNGYAFKSSLFCKDRGVPLIRIRDIFNKITEHCYDGNYQDEFLVKKDDILIGMDGDFKIAIWKGEKGLLNQRVCRISLTTNLYNRKFLILCLQPYLDAINAETSSVTVKHLSSRTVEEIPLPLPPLAEQHRIVAKIEELFSDIDAGIASLKKAREQLKIYRQAVLKWAFEGKLTARWREEKKQKGELKTADELLARFKIEREKRYKEQMEEWESSVKAWEVSGKVGRKPKKPQKLNDFTSLPHTEIKKLPELPVEWKWVGAANILDEINNGYTPNKEKLNPLNGEIPFIKIYNLTHDGRLDFKNLTFISKQTHEKELKRSIVYPNDILFNIVGPPLGKVSLVPFDYPEYNINQAIVLFRPNQNYLPKFLMYALLTKTVINWILNTGKATAGQINLRVSSCREQMLPLCSLEEQNQIVQEIESRLSICDRLETTIAENLQRAEALRQSILKRAFEGKLVPQDPNDEPAEKLLERIKEEKSKRSTRQLSLEGL